MTDNSLPFRAETSAGDSLDICFPLHPDTGDPDQVGRLIGAILAAIESERTQSDASNGDVMQALTMALSIRAGMVYGHHEAVEKLTWQLLRSALDAVHYTDRRAPQIGHA